MRNAAKLAKLSTVDPQSGAVFVRDGKTLAGGHALIPENIDTPVDGVRVAIGLALKQGVTLKNSYLYTTSGVDADTAKLLVLAGVRKVVSHEICSICATEILDDAKIEVVIRNKPCVEDSR